MNHITKTNVHKHFHQLINTTQIITTGILRYIITQPINSMSVSRVLIDVEYRRINTQEY